MVMNVFILLFFFYGPLLADIIHIPEDFSLIQMGIDASADGDTIILSNGIYSENIELSGSRIVLGSEFLLDGHSSHITDTVLDGDHNGSCAVISDSPSVEITGLTVTHGSGSPVEESILGGGILVLNSAVDLKYLYVTQNEAQYGGGIFTDNAAVFMSHCLIFENMGLPYGAGIFTTDNNEVHLQNLTIVNNTATTGEVVGVGGGICGWGDIHLVNCIVWFNTGSEITGNMFASYSAIPDYMGAIDGEVVFGAGVIHDDPLLQNWQSGNLQLTAESPCIDHGDPSLPFDADLTLSDMGALYFHQPLECGPAGDLNWDNSLDVLDIVLMVACLLGEGINLPCPCGDANSDGATDILDIVLLVSFILA